MKLLITGDWHLTDLSPARRIDDYVEAMFNKLQQIGEIASETGCTAILQPGDFFDAFRVSEIMKTRVLNFVNSLAAQSIEIVTIPGQHDMRFRDFDLSNTSLGVLAAGHTVKVMPSSEFPGWMGIVNDQTVCIYACPFGAEIPEIKDLDCFNVLLVHLMVTSKGPLWPGQVDYVAGGALLKKHPYDLIVSGDNHQAFFVDQKGRTLKNQKKQSLINCGSLMRSATNQTQHTPHVWVFDTLTGEKIQYDLEVAPAADIFNFAKAEGVEISTTGLDSFITSMRDNMDAGERFSYFNMVKQYLKSNKKIKAGVKDVVAEVITAVNEQTID